MHPETTSESIRERLIAIYSSLYRCYGPQHWWPAEEPFEVVVGAILTQSTAWTNVEKAISNLKAADVLSSNGMMGLDLAELASLIRSSGYFNEKAKKLKAFVEHLAHQHGGELNHLFAQNTPLLREELLGIHGIGPETADSIILYAAGQPVFVVDAYTVRLFDRLGFESATGGYLQLQGLFTNHLPADALLFNEYHALIVRHGKYVCRKQPSCADCVLRLRCLLTSVISNT